MYEFIVLAHLFRRPMHGYMIAKIIGNIMGPFRHVQWGALYPVLSRLERDGLIRGEACVRDDDGRPRKVYTITDAGRERLHERLMDTQSHRGEYDTIFFLKVALFSELSPEERLFLSRDYAVYAQQNVDHFQHKRRDLIDSPHLSDDQKGCVFRVIDHRIAYWQHERAWAEELIAEERHQKEAV